MRKVRSCVFSRLRLVCISLVLSLVVSWSVGVQAEQGTPQPLTPEQAKSHMGEKATVCGTVASAKYAATSRGSPTFLNLDRPYPHTIFTAVIWGADRAKFGTPEVEYLGKRLCVTGQSESYRDSPEIIVTERTQLTVPSR